MRVAVVGAGVIGLCTAWYLRKDGHDVTVYDRGGPDGDKCSLGNAGIIVPSHFIPLAAPGMVAAGLKMMAKRASPFRIKPSLDPALGKWCVLFMKHCTEEHVDRCAPFLRDLHLESRNLFRSLTDVMGDSFGFEERGMLMLCSTEEGLREETRVAEHAKRLGLRAEVLDSHEVARLETGVATNVVGGVHFLNDCHLAPHTFVNRLQLELARSGVAYSWNTALDDLGRIRADNEVVVIAAGTWSGMLADTIGLSLPLQPGKGLNVSLTAPVKTPVVPSLLKEARIAVTPMEGGVRFAGTMELGEWGLAPDRVRAGAMVKSIANYLPDYPAAVFEDVAVWTGLRPCSPDGMPYIGRTRFADNVLLATGHGMMGLSLGPVTGMMIADIVAGRAPTSDLLSPDRFA